MGGLVNDYAPGTVAIATVRGVKGVKVVRVASSLVNAPWVTVERLDGSGAWHYDSDVTDIKPLVVLDLGYHPDQYVHALRWVEHQSGQGYPFIPSPANERNDACWIADQIEAQTRPPRIPEPNGLGAVVANANGHKFVRVADVADGWAHGRQWQRIGGEINAVRNFGWPEINAVKVLSEGLS
jgi:hypothetical protein